MSLFIIFFVSTKIDIILGNDNKYGASNGAVPRTVICVNDVDLCEITCDNDNSCDGVSVYSAADKTKIQCSGDNSCHNLLVYIGVPDAVPHGFNVSNFQRNAYDSGEIQCTGDDSCSNSNIEINGKFNTVNIEIKQPIASNIYCNISSLCELICGDYCQLKKFICPNNCQCDANCNIIPETMEPTQISTTSTIFPSKSAIMEPSQSPSKSPAKSPTELPTMMPTKMPISQAILTSKSPTISPTKSPTTASRIFPSQSPIQLQSMTPTNNPTIMPTKMSASPTRLPSKAPTRYSIINKPSSISPTKVPTNISTNSPTNNITTSATTTLTTKSPSQTPTHFPSAQLPSLITSQ